VHLQTEQDIKNIEVFSPFGQSVIKTTGKDVSLAALSNGINLLGADTVIVNHSPLEYLKNKGTKYM